MKKDPRFRRKMAIKKSRFSVDTPVPEVSKKPKAPKQKKESKVPEENEAAANVSAE